MNLKQFKEHIVIGVDKLTNGSVQKQIYRYRKLECGRN